MKIKTSELTGAALDWAVANPGKVSRYMSVMERVHRQSSMRPNGCREWNGKKNMHGYGTEWARASAVMTDLRKHLFQKDLDREGRYEQYLKLKAEFE